MVRDIGLQIPEIAESLAAKFWAGPLTMVLKRLNDTIPREISCGLDSVAVRMPDNRIFLDVIKQCGFPLAAPSANLSGSPSPTTAAHVRADLDVPVVDGGACEIGIESTVIMFDNGKIRILRPGVITAGDLQEFGEVIAGHGVSSREREPHDSCAPLSPGTRHKHYSPKAKVITYEGETPTGEFVIDNPDTQTLYAKFREYDALGADRIYVRLPDESGVGLALRNRILRAAED
jgi:L-threonylcarbamoyladenylate synthase